MPPEKKEVGSLIPTEAIPPRMIFIPHGNVILGTSQKQVMNLIETEEWAEEWQEKGHFRIEQPQHIVEIPGFEIAAAPITNAEYNLFVWETNYKPPKYWFGFKFPEGLGDHPVVGVTKEDAEAYIQWVNSELKTNFRLPTELEWERAARGDDARIYPWGDVFDPWRCNTLESGKKLTTPIASYSPGGDSPFGVTDMVGNVWEWTSSYLDPYPYKSHEIQKSAGDNQSKCVVRGGAWYYSRKLARCSVREGVISSFQSPALGFRLARSLD